MRRSRLNKNKENNNKKTIFLSIAGIVIVIFLLIKFGLLLLSSLSLFLSGVINKQGLVENNNQINFITPPILNPLPYATNSAEIIISGRSEKDMLINLYINDRNVNQTKVDDKGNFSFTETLEISDNQIKANVQYEDKKSDFSNIINITYSISAPSLEINSPSEGQQFKKDQNVIIVKGKTDSGVSITVNGFWAVIDENNNFSYNLSLQNGDNEIKVIATDQAGNKFEKILKVNYSQ